jgi:hypothetical protein
MLTLAGVIVEFGAVDVKVLANKLLSNRNVARGIFNLHSKQLPFVAKD